MSTVICLGGGVESVPMIRRVKDMGHTAIVVDWNQNAPGGRIADVFLCASCYDGATLVDILEQAQVSLHLDYDAVLCCGVDAPVACAMVAERFGLPGLSVEQAKLGQHKAMQIAFLTDGYVLTPLFALAYSPYNAVMKCDGDRVIKPIDSRGGRGVIRLLPSVDREWAFQQAFEQSPSEMVMIEQWVDGPQLSTESIIQDGEVLFTAIGLRNYDRLDEFAPYCIEDGFDAPYGDEDLRRQVDEVIAQACEALNWYQHGAGTVKGDLVIHNGRVYVIELACRLSGGFFATHGHPLAYGVDFVGYAIRAALGERLEAPTVKSGMYVSQRYVFPRPEDIGKTIVGFEDSTFGDFSTWNIKIGQTISPVTCHPNRWGQVIEFLPTPEAARAMVKLQVKKMYESVVVG